VHFLSEGVDKVTDPAPFSGAFFGNAKGPLAPLFKQVVWDPDGEHRLNLDATLDHWDDYRNRLVSHYGFDEPQTKKADQVLKTYEGRLKQFLSANSAEIEEYYHWVDRRKENAQDATRHLASLQKHDARIATETAKLRGQLIPPIDGLWGDLEDDLNAIATQEQWERHGRLAIGKPGRAPVDSETADMVVPWFDLAIGACLILGLFTRPAALLGAAFLAMICVSQWPGSPGAVPVYNQAIEMLALVALAAIGAGRFFGLDAICYWCCGAGRARKTTTIETVERR
jgi:uncharacterized membrane protein YphA (DoxX/SURF4 family)